MTTMQKFKAYFGMVPPSDYEDDYLEEPGVRGSAHGYRDSGYRDDYRDQGFRDGYGPDAFDDGFRDLAPREGDYYDGPRGGYDDARFDDARYGDARFGDVRFEDARVEDARYAEADYPYAGGPRHVSEPVDRLRAPRLEPLQRSASATLRAANAGPAAMSSEQRAELERVFADGPLQQITTLRPSDYSEARTIGERYRNGNPVIMDLVDMSNDDAKRLVDFAAGLAFALRGSFDKVATKVFLLSPADIDVTPEDRRKIAETGFYNHS